MSYKVMKTTELGYGFTEYDGEHYITPWCISKLQDDLEKANSTIRALTVRLLATETLQDTQGGSQHPYEDGRDHDPECDTSQGIETNEEYSDTMDKQGGETHQEQGAPPSYRQIEQWVELESKKRRAIDPKDGTRHLQPDETTKAISDNHGEKGCNNE